MSLQERYNQLVREVEEVRAKLKKQEEEAREKRRDAVLDDIDAFLSLVTFHGCTSCSDDNPINYSRARCGRCFLLRCKKYDCWEDTDVDVGLSFRYQSEDDFQ